MLLLGTLVVVVIVVRVVVALVVVCSICCNCAATFCAHWENARNATPLLADSLCECACVCVYVAHPFAVFQVLWPHFNGIAVTPFSRSLGKYHHLMMLLLLLLPAVIR